MAATHCFELTDGMPLNLSRKCLVKVLEQKGNLHAHSRASFSDLLLKFVVDFDIEFCVNLGQENLVCLTQLHNAVSLHKSATTL